MATSISNVNLDLFGQKGVVALNGFKDKTNWLTLAYDETVNYTDAVRVPLLSYGATASGKLDFLTDDSNTVNGVSLVASNIAKSQYTLTPVQYKKLSGITDQMVSGLVRTAAKTISDAALALVTATNFATKTVVATWSESAPTLLALQTAVNKAWSTGTIDPSNTYVVMPGTTYGAFMAVLNALPREIDLGFKIIPVYSSAFSLGKTFITDGSGVLLGIGQDVGTEYEEVGNYKLEDGSIGYALHVVQAPLQQQVIIAARMVYGVGVGNPNGITYLSAS